MGEKIIDPELRKFFDSLKVKDTKSVTKPVETKEKTLHKDEPVKEQTYESDKEAFKAIRKEYRAEMLARESTSIESDDIYSHRLYYGSTEKKLIMSHAYTLSELGSSEKS